MNRLVCIAQICHRGEQNLGYNFVCSTMLRAISILAIFCSSLSTAFSAYQTPQPSGLASTTATSQSTTSTPSLSCWPTYNTPTPVWADASVFCTCNNGGNHGVAPLGSIGTYDPCPATVTPINPTATPATNNPFPYTQTDMYGAVMMCESSSMLDEDFGQVTFVRSFCAHRQPCRSRVLLTMRHSALDLPWSSQRKPLSRLRRPTQQAPM